MKLPYQLQIPAPSKICNGCQIPFHSGQELTSELDKEWERKDYCASCYKESPGMVWKTQFKQDVIEKKVNLDECQAAWELLGELISSTEKECVEEAFILALFLQRKKIITAKKNNENALLFEKIDSGEVILIHPIDITQLSIPEVEKRLKVKLNGK